ncbi:MAG: hypothetical protein A3H35_00800 [Betaproteobacteria bacterium RIFCSPLOWO2_02_FULL_62_17]|nr:MAG: hypothetical protein A3H35_00800 [Betaproteobacteria bacterium RIFCSPLOWO2_02_FULL_62_17]
MAKIRRENLLTLEAYAKERAAFRSRIIAHKKNRMVQIGAHLVLHFEDELTIRYQIQEMLRVEKIFEESGIQEELEAYNPLVPDGRNLKATMMLEYEDATERAKCLAGLIGIEDKVWMQAGDCPKTFAIADEDLDRENADKTSSVHFLRFEFDDVSVQALRTGSDLFVGVDHETYSGGVTVPAQVRQSLLRDFSL